ncbi:hypothetical protein PFISCL1PPCAC_15113, partial [Pristionchus fissidentatus]
WTMPLGLFGSSSSSKPQILPSEKSGEKAKHKSEKRDSCDNGRGTVLRLEKHVVTIEKKLAEGGFAIVYLVSDQKNRQFALKRQFVNDDTQQVDSCKRECLILSSLRGHRNIVQYVDHLVMKNKTGVYDCMLLTAYYKSSILQWMNARLSENRFFSSAEILSIFCDMSEAVARLHHATTPLIHRDLKVENILVDDRNRGAAPIFVLCDFGSATTRVLSTENHSITQVEQEIERYTTLSYRSPEMVDLYSRKSIGTPSDIWAMGVMLYKLSFFSLPFGESPLAIQNAAFSFPSQPMIQPAIKAIIKLLLSSDPGKRPNIHQTASLAFEASNKVCPIHNIHNVSTVSLSAALSFLEGGPHPLASNQSPSVRSIEMKSTKLGTPPSPRVLSSSSLVNTLESPTRSLPISSSTSVNPRLRPKPSGIIPRVPLIGSATSSPQLPRANPPDILPSSTLIPTVDEKRALLPPSGLELEVRESTVVGTTVEVEEAVDTKEDTTVTRHMRNLSDGGTLSKSAFRPYSETAPKTTVINIGMNEGDGLGDGGEESGKGTWNAFQDAPIDDSVGGRGGWVETEDDEVDWSDPFRSAPFDPLPLMKERERQRMSTEEEKMVESESDVDEQRALNRRSFSYEHIDGVGDDASTDSRGRTDGDTTEDTGKENEEHDDGMSTEGETTDGGTMDDVAGSRPLLDDDGLEEDVDDEEEYETVTSSSCLPLSTTPVPSSQHVIPPSTITFPSSTTVLNQPPSSQSTTVSRPPLATVSSNEPSPPP